MITLVLLIYLEEIFDFFLKFSELYLVNVL